VSRLVGRSEKLIGERLDLLRLPNETRALLAARKVPLGCAPALTRIAEREPLPADLASVWLAERPQAAAAFPADPGEVVDDVLESVWGTKTRRPPEKSAICRQDANLVTPHGRAEIIAIGVPSTRPNDAEMLPGSWAD